jgi:uncharacterized membrane protein YuzA (DUF378 family)
LPNVRARRRRSPARADANSVPGLGLSDAESRGGAFVGRAGQDSGWSTTVSDGLGRRGAGDRLGPLGWIALGLLALAGLRWALAGLAGIDLVATVAEPGSVLARSVDALTGTAALYAVYLLANSLRR